MSIAEIYEFISPYGDWTIRLFLALLCGCLIGYERTNRNKDAGLRTHSIISLSAALLVIVSKYGFLDDGATDGSRVAAQIVTGVGFLGAGIIYVKNETVQGVTTAAGMWATAGVGMCIGAGMYIIGSIATIIIISFQSIFHSKYITNKKSYTLSVVLEIYTESDALDDIYTTLDDYDICADLIKLEKIGELTQIYLDTAISGKEQKRKFIRTMAGKSYINTIHII